MSKNPLPILLLLLLAKNKNSINPPAINTLQVEAFLDNAHKMVSTIDKISNLAQQSPQNLPDMNKILDVASPLLTALSATNPEVNSLTDSSESGD